MLLNLLPLTPPPLICVLLWGCFNQEGFSGGSVVKNPPAKAGDTGSIPGMGRSRGGNDNPLQYSCLGNLKDGGARWATVHGVTKKSDTTQ